MYGSCNSSLVLYFSEYAAQDVLLIRRLFRELWLHGVWCVLDKLDHLVGVGRGFVVVDESSAHVQPEGGEVLNLFQVTQSCRYIT